MVEPRDYNSRVEDLDLYDIRLVSSVVELNDILADLENFEVEFENDSSFENSASSTVCMYEKLRVRIHHRHTGADLVTILVTIKLTFSSPRPIDDEFFGTYKYTSLKLHSWPYLREYVQNITSRMNIPPLTLPLFKLGAPKQGSKEDASPKPEAKRRRSVKS